MAETADLIDLSNFIEKRKVEKLNRQIDIAASYEQLRNCLGYLEMNKIPELENVKQEIKKAIKKLEKLQDV